MEKSYNIMLGIGCGKPGYEMQMPLATVGLLASAESVRCSYGYGKGIIIIADMYALDEYAEVRRQTMHRLLVSLGLSSCWDITGQKEIHGNMNSGSGNGNCDIETYVRQEAEDVRVLLNDTGIKIGWAISSDPWRGGEVEYDNYIKNNLAQTKYEFKYAQPAIKFNGRRDTPYCTANPQGHILIPASNSWRLKNFQRLPEKLHEDCFTFLDQIATLLINRHGAKFLPVTRNTGKWHKNTWEIAGLEEKINHALSFIF